MSKVILRQKGMDDFLYDLPHGLLERGTVDIPLRPKISRMDDIGSFAQAVEANVTKKTFKLKGSGIFGDKVYPVFEELL